MKNIKKTLFFVALLVVAKPVQARTVAVPAENGSWLSSTVSAIGSAAAKLLPSAGAIGTAAASSLIPFGLGPVATVAAPYLIAAGTNYITKKVSGIDLAKEKYQEELKDEVGHLTKMMRKRDRQYTKMIRKIRKLRRLRHCRQERELEYDMDRDDDIVDERDEEMDDYYDYDEQDEKDYDL